MQGGYDLTGLNESVSDSIAGVLGEASLDKHAPDSLHSEPLDKVARVLQDVRRIHEL